MIDRLVTTGRDSSRKRLHQLLLERRSTDRSCRRWPFAEWCSSSAIARADAEANASGGSSGRDPVFATAIPQRFRVRLLRVSPRLDRADVRLRIDGRKTEEIQGIYDALGPEEWDWNHLAGLLEVASGAQTQTAAPALRDKPLRSGKNVDAKRSGRPAVGISRSFDGCHDGLVSRATATLCATTSGPPVVSRSRRAHAAPPMARVRPSRVGHGNGQLLYDATALAARAGRFARPLHVRPPIRLFSKRLERSNLIDVNEFRQYEKDSRRFYCRRLSWGQSTEVEAALVATASYEETFRRCDRQAPRWLLGPNAAALVALPMLQRRGVDAKDRHARPAGVFQQVLSSSISGVPAGQECYAAALLPWSCLRRDGIHRPADRRRLMVRGLRPANHRLQTVRNRRSRRRLDSFADVVSCRTFGRIRQFRARF